MEQAPQPQAPEPAVFDINIPDLATSARRNCIPNSCISVNEDGFQCAKPKHRKTRYCEIHYSKCAKSHTNYKKACEIYDTMKKVHSILSMNIYHISSSDAADIEMVRALYNNILAEYRNVVKCYAALKLHYTDSKCVHIDCVDDAHARRLVNVRNIIIHLANLLQALHDMHTDMSRDKEIAQTVHEAQSYLPEMVTVLKKQIQSAISGGEKEENIDQILQEYEEKMKQTNPELYYPFTFNDEMRIKMVCDSRAELVHMTPPPPTEIDKCKAYMKRLIATGDMQMFLEYYNESTLLVLSKAYKLPAIVKTPSYDMGAIARMFIRSEHFSIEDRLKKMIVVGMRNARNIAEFVIDKVVCSIDPPVNGYIDLIKMHNVLKPYMKELRQIEDHDFKVITLLYMIESFLFMKKTCGHSYSSNDPIVSVLLSNMLHFNLIDQKESRKRKIILYYDEIPGYSNTFEIELGLPNHQIVPMHPNVWHFGITKSMTLQISTSTLALIYGSDNQTLIFDTQIINPKYPNIKRAILRRRSSS